jgi:hypothetical protein
MYVFDSQVYFVHFYFLQIEIKFIFDPPTDF